MIIPSKTRYILPLVVDDEPGVWSLVVKFPGIYGKNEELDNFLVMTNSLPWYRWPIEIDGLPGFTY